MNNQAKYFKRGVVTDDYVQEIEHRLYNNLPLDSLYSSAQISTAFDEQAVKEILKEGEEYVRLEHNLDHFIITSYGRAINIKRFNVIKPTITPHTLHCYVSKGNRTNTKLEFEDIFLQQGWDFDIEKITKIYKKYKWSARYFFPKK